MFREGAPADRRGEGEEIFQQKNTPYPSQEQVKREQINRGEHKNGMLCSPGVTGFDGLFVEKRATQCTPAHHLNLAGNKLAKNTLASVKSPYFGQEDFAFAYAKV